MSKYRETPYTFVEYILKRSLDYVLSIIALLFIGPLMALVALAIRLDSPGPAIYKQKRVGLNGEIFEVIKFRSMATNIDDSFHKAHILAYTSGQLDEKDGVKLKVDPRITRVGRFIRKTSIDELPQIFNVLQGHMSLVGPRPLPIYEVEQFNLWHSERLKVLPGITGMWQVVGRSYVSFDEQLRLDIRYIRNYSLLLDLKLIFKTIPAILSRKGAG